MFVLPARFGFVGGVGRVSPVSKVDRQFNTGSKVENLGKCGVLWLVKLPSFFVTISLPNKLDYSSTHTAKLLIVSKSLTTDNQGVKRMAKTEYEFRTAIKEDLLANYEEIISRPYPEDYLSETADSWSPIYNSDIIEIWSSPNGMPNYFMDSWQEIGANDNDGIISRMRVDVYLWLDSLTRELWEEILEEKEEVA